MLSIEDLQGWVYIISKNKPLCRLRDFVFPGICKNLYIESKVCIHDITSNLTMIVHLKFVKRS